MLLLRKSDHPKIVFGINQKRGVMAITTTTIFINNRTQAVRLPVEVRLPDDLKKVTARIRGRERIIAPLENTWDRFFTNEHMVSDDFMKVGCFEKLSRREEF